MKLKVLHLEDSPLKYAAIAQILRSVASVEIDWVTDMASGIEKIEKSLQDNVPYDLAITDMHYPLSKGIKPDWEAGDFFLETVKYMKIDLPVIICSTHNMRNEEAFGCVWYNEKNDWQSEIRCLIKKLIKEKASDKSK